MFFATEVFRARAGPTSANKFPPRVKNTAVGKTQVWRALTFRELPGATGIASIDACIQKLRLVEKYIKYQDTRGRNVNVSWFGVTRTPEDAPNTPEDALAVFCSTFRELPGATGITSIGVRIQKLRLTEIKVRKISGHTRGRNVMAPGSE